MILGAVLLLAALSLFLRNRQEDAQAAASVEALLPQIHAQIAAAEAAAKTAAEDAAPPDPFDPTMTEIVIDGYAYIGYLSVPSLGLELPVMSAWDETRLKIAPCRYAGSTKSDDLVIAGHNYRRHFSPLKQLVPGDAVYFFDMDGVCSAYEVVVLETLPPAAVEDMTAGAYDLTLFTCTYGGQNRFTVRCDRIETP